MDERIRDYRDLVAWQRAMQLAVLVSGITRQLPRYEWEPASQMRRAANSVFSNIAEGNGRDTTADYLRHLYISRASLNEIESDLQYVLQTYGASIDARHSIEFAVAVRKPLLGLIKALEHKRERER